MGQTSDYKIHFCYNKRLTNKKACGFDCAADFLRDCPQEFLEFNVCLTVNTQHTFSMYLRRHISEGDLFILCMIVSKSIQAILSNDLIRLISNVFVKSLETTIKLSIKTIPSLSSRKNSTFKFQFHQIAELLRKTKILLICLIFLK